jgi:hypothetical protein
MIADNKIAENAGWDENLLRQELQALEGEDFNLRYLALAKMSWMNCWAMMKAKA